MPLDSATVETTYPARVPRHRINVAIGIALSLLLHGMLVAWSWNRKLPVSDQASQAVAIEVRLRQLTAPPPAPPAEEEKQPKRKVASQAPPAATPRSIQAEHPAATAIVQAPAVEPRPQPVEKHLDMAAVHASIGKAVAEVDRESRDTPNGQLQTKPLYAPQTENRMGDAIASTARPDCKESVQGLGLLAPLALLAMAADKKDSGCKW